MASTVTVQFEVDAEGAVRGVENLDDSTEELGESIDDTRQKSEAFANALKIGFTLAAGAAVAAVSRFGSSLFRLGVDVQETQQLFETVFGPQSRRQIEAFGEQTANAMGLTRSEFKEAAAQVGGFTETLDLTGEEFTSVTLQILEMAGDLASSFNIEMDDALNRLISGLVGNTDALRGLNIVFQASEVEARAAAMGFADLEGEAGRTGQTLARLDLISQRAGSALGDLQRSQGSVAQETRILRAELRQITEELAVGLLPVFSDILRNLRDFVRENEDAVLRVLRELTQAIGEVILAGIELATFLGSAEGIAQFERIAARITDAFGGVLSVIRGVLDAIDGIAFGTVDLAEELAAVASAQEAMEGYSASLRQSAEDRIAAAEASRDQANAFDRMRGSVQELMDMNVSASFAQRQQNDAVKGFERIVDTIEPKVRSLSEALAALIQQQDVEFVPEIDPEELQGLDEVNRAIEVIQRSLDQVSTEEARDQLEQLLEVLFEMRDRMQSGEFDIGGALGDSLANAVAGLAEAIGDGDNIMDALLENLGRAFQQLGRAAIAYGITMSAIISNPVAAIGAGAGLVAAGAALRRAQGGVEQAAGGTGGRATIRGGGIAGLDSVESFRHGGMVAGGQLVETHGLGSREFFMPAMPGQIATAGQIQSDQDTGSTLVDVRTTVDAPEWFEAETEVRRAKRFKDRYSS